MEFKSLPAQHTHTFDERTLIRFHVGHSGWYRCTGVRSVCSGCSSPAAPRSALASLLLCVGVLLLGSWFSVVGMVARWVGGWGGGGEQDGVKINELMNWLVLPQRIVFHSKAIQSLSTRLRREPAEHGLKARLNSRRHSR